MKLKRVTAHVLDIDTQAGWWEYDQKEHDQEQATIPITGVQVSRDDKWLILASSYAHGSWLNRVSIPAAIVRRVEILGDVEV